MPIKRLLRAILAPIERRLAAGAQCPGGGHAYATDSKTLRNSRSRQRQRGPWECMVRGPLASKIFVVGGWFAQMYPGLFAEPGLLANMESARRWSMKWLELRRVLLPTQACPIAA